MLSKKEIKDIQSLANKNQRDERRLFVAEGPKIVTELAQMAPQNIVAIYALPAWADANPHLPALHTVTETELYRLSHLKTPNEVLAVVRRFEWQPPNALKGFCLYLDQIQDPGNMGTIIRIGDWFGVDQIVCSPGCADVYGSKVVQSSMASIARVPVWYDADGKWLTQQNGPIFAATLQGELLSSYQKEKKAILIIGNESKGISPGVLALATHPITIPRRGGAESLNAAVATGIILWHLLS